MKCVRPPRRYQFQSFAQYRGKLAQKTAEELDTLRTHEDVWSVLGVLNYLQALVDNSGIVAELSAPGANSVTRSQNDIAHEYARLTNVGWDICLPPAV